MSCGLCGESLGSGLEDHVTSAHTGMPDLTRWHCAHCLFVTPEFATLAHHSQRMTHPLEEARLEVKAEAVAALLTTAAVALQPRPSLALRARLPSPVPEPQDDETYKEELKDPTDLKTELNWESEETDSETRPTDESFSGFTASADGATEDEDEQADNRSTVDTIQKVHSKQFGEYKEVEMKGFATLRKSMESDSPSHQDETEVRSKPGGFPCSRCHRIFIKDFGLKAHLKSCKPNPCCDQDFENNEYLQRHRRSDQCFLNGRRFCCLDCGVEYNRKSKLVRHLKLSNCKRNATESEDLSKMKVPLSTPVVPVDTASTKDYGVLRRVTNPPLTFPAMSIPSKSMDVVPQDTADSPKTDKPPTGISTFTPRVRSVKGKQKCHWCQRSFWEPYLRRHLTQKKPCVRKSDLLCCGRDWKWANSLRVHRMSLSCSNSPTSTADKVIGSGQLVQ